MNIVITNTCALNGGDAAILKSLVESLRDEWGDCKITCYDSHAEAAARYYPELTFRKLLYVGYGETGCPIFGLRYLWRLVKRCRFRAAAWLWSQGQRGWARSLGGKEAERDLSIYEKADLVISNGGTYLREHCGLGPRIYDFTIARWLKKPLVLFTQSLGPFREKRFRKDIKEVFDYADLILLRDEKSKEHLAELGVNSGKVRIFPDIAFYCGQKRRKSVGKRNEHVPLRAAVSVRQWSYFDNSSTEAGMEKYKGMVADIVTHLVRNYGVEVTFLSTCQGIREYWANDAGVAEEIRRGLDEEVREQVRVDGEFHEPGSLRERLGEFDFVVATRMHAAILAMTAGVAVFPIAYEFKTQELFEQMGLGKWMEDINSLEREACLAKLDDFMANRKKITERVTEVVGDYGREARGAVDEVRKVWEELKG